MQIACQRVAKAARPPLAEGVRRYYSIFIKHLLLVADIGGGDMDGSRRPAVGKNCAERKFMPPQTPVKANLVKTCKSLDGYRILPKNNLQNGGAGGILMNVDKINTISSPIEQARRSTGQGRPNAILHTGAPLNDRQQALLYRLPKYDSRVTVKKNDVSMKDLSALTAKTGVEFAMFTRKHERLIVRGDAAHVNISPDSATLLSAQGYKWSGHTHVGLYDGWELTPSDGDLEILSRFAQKESAIYNANGKSLTFEND